MSAPAPGPGRPRPRPRPRPRLAGSKAEDTKIDISQTASSSKSPVLVVDDDDAMFIRNSSRGMMSRKGIEEAVEKREALAPKLPSDSEVSDSDPDGGTTQRRSRKAHKSKAKSLPAWVLNGATKKRRQLESSDDEKSDNSLYILDDSSNEKDAEKTPQTKRRREKSRSPSLTPPPPVPVYKIQTAQNIVRNALANSSPRRKPPPIVLEDDSDDEPIVLAPELAKISAEFKGKQSTLRQPSLDIDAIGNDTDPTLSAEVTLRIKWLPHPEDEAGKTEEWQLKQKRGESFRGLLDEIADEVGILSSDLKLTFNGIHVYPVSTPRSLGIWSEALLEACTSNTREYIDNQKKARALSPLHANEPEISSFAGRHNSVADSGAESEVSQHKDDDDKFKLHLRNGDRTIVVSVRSTTKCSSIVATFLRKTNRPAKLAKKVYVEIDGEKMNPNSPIGDAELEDGDLVDIVGL